MPPKSHNIHLLFHPKKKDQKAPAPPPPKARPKPPTAVEKKEEEEEEHFQLPDVPFQEFRLLSSSLKGWKYDVMKFDARKSVDILQWTPPVKLNRKDLRRQDRSTEAAKVPEAVGPMLGADGKPVLQNGKVVMVDAEGRPIPDSDGAGPSKDKDKAKGPNNKKRFQKKTRQVFLVPDDVRKLQREERYPWVIEDSNPVNKELWIGQLEDIQKGKTHAFFMPTASDAFKFVPAHRWYKFQKKLKHEFPTDTADVESAYLQSQKKDPTAWLASLNGGKGASSQMANLFKPEQDVKPVIGAPPGPGGRRLKAVDRPVDSLFDDDDDAGARRRREKDMGGEGDLEEQEYEEEFADDEETAAVDGDDEEAKEIEERMKREYQKANKHREAGIDEDEEEEEVPTADKSVKKMQKMIRSREGNNVYESEDEGENPYASSAEEEEEEEPVQTGPAIQPQPQQTDSRTGTPKPVAGGSKPTLPPGVASRATSPAVSPNHGGHSLIAQRATSPKIPRPKTPGNRSPAASPPGSRATSPLASTPLKRKSDDHGQPKPKKIKVEGASNPITKEELEKLLIEWLKNTPKATTRDCIQHFNSYLNVSAERKKDFSGLVKQVAFLRDGFLALRPGV